jgi:hypothetical protein
MVMSGQIHALTSLYLHPLNMMLDWPQRRTACLREEKHFLPLQGIKPRILGCPAFSLVARPNNLYWLPKGAGVSRERQRKMQMHGRQTLMEFILSSVHRQ